MPPLDAPIAPRHARMFEYLRQSQQAEQTNARLAEPVVDYASSQTLDNWCAQAQRSLGLDPTHSAA